LAGQALSPHDLVRVVPVSLKRTLRNHHDSVTYHHNNSNENNSDSGGQVAPSSGWPSLLLVLIAQQWARTPVITDTVVFRMSLVIHLVLILCLFQVMIFNKGAYGELVVYEQQLSMMFLGFAGPSRAADSTPLRPDSTPLRAVLKH
jgi:hypothetical protein